MVGEGKKYKKKMSVRLHCEGLTRLLFALEANVHERLGYFPCEFRETCRRQVSVYLTTLESELTDELAAVGDALRALQDFPQSGKEAIDSAGAR